ncbi:hypothetical protein G9A89_014876 [Geosiphon pyriformis]|nr:hypothetical protein G9A89_014876 [Geosiphon pyriformis]
MFVPRVLKRPESSVKSSRQTKKIKTFKIKEVVEEEMVPADKLVPQVKSLNSELRSEIQSETDLKKTGEKERNGNLELKKQEERKPLVNEVEDEKVKEFSSQQRAPIEGEPICVVCGRYGEYICDQTDHDVCSLECKKIDIKETKTDLDAMDNLHFIKEPVIQSSHQISSIYKSIRVPFHSANELFHAKLTGYVSHPELISWTDYKLKSILAKNLIVVKGNNIPHPVTNFSHCSLPENIYQNLQRHGYLEPTPIQMQAIPAGLAGRDILASAETGSGKTLSFLIPVVTHAFSLSQYYERGKNGPYALILAPTRELCAQLEQQAKLLIIGLPNMKTGLLVGGLPLPNQIHRLSQGVQIAFATPGRFLEILKREKEEVLMGNIHMVVLDEVDMMFKMGFEVQVMEILKKLPLPITTTHRQTLMFSATIPQDIQALTIKILRDPLNIRIGNGSLPLNSQTSSITLNSTPNFSVKQTILWVENKSKKKQLFSLLNDPKYYHPPIVVFVESRLGADLLAQAIEKKCGKAVLSIHGDKTQQERIEILNAFLQGTYEVIVSTGVLSRGLNLTNVNMVILFDMAMSVDEYVHQVGRAAKWGNQGWAITFINEEHKALFKEFVTMLKSQPLGKVTPLPSRLLNHGYTIYGKR